MITALSAGHVVFCYSCIIRSAGIQTFPYPALKMYIEDIIEACRRIINGNTEALAELGLDNITYPHPTLLNTSPGGIQVTYNAVLNTAVAARELQLGFVEKQCQLTMDALKTIAVAKKMDLQHNVDGADVVEIMLALIDEERKRLFSVRNRSEASPDSEFKEEMAAHLASEDVVAQVQPPPPAAVYVPPQPPGKAGWRSLGTATSAFSKNGSTVTC